MQLCFEVFSKFLDILGHFLVGIPGRAGEGLRTFLARSRLNVEQKLGTLVGNRLEAFLNDCFGGVPGTALQLSSRILAESLWNLWEGLLTQRWEECANTIPDLA